MINRQLNGFPDHHGHGFFSNGQQAETLVPPVGKATTDPDNVKCGEFENGIYDSELDVFIFSFAGHSGKFVIGHDQTITIIPHRKFVIEPDVPPTQDIQSFTITTDDGIKYHFTDPIQTSSLPPCRQRNSQQDAYVYNSSWYLTKVEYPNALDEINLTYSDPFTIVTNHVTNETHLEFLFAGEQGVTGDPLPCNGDIKYESVRLETIESSLFKVELEAQTGRQDLSHPPFTTVPDKMLDQILIKDLQGNLIKSFRLDHSYFTNTTNDQYNKRLRLDSLVEVGLNGLKKPPHVFEYNTSIELPSLKSKGQDLWGFYNGKSNNSLIPQLQVNVAQYSTLFNGQFFKNYGSADRSIDITQAQFAMLEKITYPTGGYTTFQYQGNEYNIDFTRNYVPSTQSAFRVAEEPRPQDLIIYGDPTTHSASADFENTIFEETEFFVPFQQKVKFTGSVTPDFYRPPAGNLEPDDGKREVEILRFDEGLTDWVVMLTENNLANCQNCETGSFTIIYDLEPGRYKLTALSDVDLGGNLGAAYIQAEVYGSFEKPFLVNKNEALGGLRVNKISTFSGANSTPRVKKYQYTLGYNSEESSGVLRKKVRYFRTTVWKRRYPDNHFQPSQQWKKLFTGVL